MKKILIVLFLLSVTAASFAQIQRDAPLPGATDSTDQTTKPPSLRQQLQALHLTKDQKIQLRALRQNAKANKETIMADDSLTQDQKLTQLKALRKQTAASFNTILTPDQSAQWQAMRAEAKKNKNNQDTQAMEEEIMSLPAN
ncbi:MAG TPA: hypothetical protein VK559_00985 [Ferruginibacter sp.]|nr:hypothetical protein [Ferruginibacter sp.]